MVKTTTKDEAVNKLATVRVGWWQIRSCRWRYGEWGGSPQRTSGLLQNSPPLVEASASPESPANRQTHETVKFSQFTTIFSKLCTDHGFIWSVTEWMLENWTKGSCKGESFVTDVMDRNIIAKISTSLVGKISVFCLKKPVLTWS